MSIAKSSTLFASVRTVRWALGIGCAAIASLLAAPAWAGPVVCTTTLEAPVSNGAVVPAGPVEVTRCGAVQTTSQLVEKRFFSYTAPFAQGVSLTNQITDLFGIAMGGGDGTKVMGFGFPDQTIVWDGTAVENTYQVLLEQQSDPMPWRTADVPNGYSGSLGSAPNASQGSTWQDGGASYGAPVRGLW
jgi:hypothetical protein